MTQRDLFIRHLAQVSETVPSLELDRAEGSFIYDTAGKKYFDLIAGISVSSTGHRHPHVLKAIHAQLEKHLHLMVYGESIQSPQVKLAKALCDLLPPSLDSVYFVNSGSEAIEGALKLAKRITGRTRILSFRNAYHGSTHGALSIMGSEEYKTSYRPLLPETYLLDFNNEEQLSEIDTSTACVVVEPIQAEGGVIVPKNDFLKKLRDRCSETGTLLILDEVQTGCGRSGTFCAFEQYGIVPDILCLAKALGGGMPLGAFISSREKMNSLSKDPPLGHITTFGGHPLSCAAALASLEVICSKEVLPKVKEKEKLFLQCLDHLSILSVRSAGLLFALEFASEVFMKKVIDRCLKNGVLTDWFLFNSRSLRLAPPLTISNEEIKESCAIICKSMDEALSC